MKAHALSSQLAHLFLLYSELLQLTLLPRRNLGGVEDGFLPIGTSAGQEDGGGADEVIGGKLDARELAGECLQLVGREFR